MKINEDKKWIKTASNKDLLEAYGENFVALMIDFNPSKTDEKRVKLLQEAILARMNKKN